MAMFIDALSWFFLLTGAFLGISGAVGMIRFPDFYSRVHAASVTDTLCALFIIFGLMLQAGLTLISVKLGIILLLLWFTAPVASHALVKAAYKTGSRPLLKQAEQEEKQAAQEKAKAQATQEGASSNS